MAKKQQQQQGEEPEKSSTMLWVLPRPGVVRCRAGIIAGGVTGLIAGVGVGIPLGTTLFEDDGKLQIGGFLAVLLLVSFLGLIGGSWGGGLTAKCWDDNEEGEQMSEESEPTSPTSDTRASRSPTSDTRA